MIRHIVLTKFKPETSEEKITDIYAGLAALSKKLPCASGFTGGRSASPEQIERGFKHGFVIDFDSWDGLASYQESEEHQVLGGKLVENSVDGINGILVLDIDV